MRRVLFLLIVVLTMAACAGQSDSAPDISIRGSQTLIFGSAGSR